nr:MAG TPA: hypothetical protein [Caudoviricetes sp.]
MHCFYSPSFNTFIVYLNLLICNHSGYLLLYTFR